MTEQEKRNLIEQYINSYNDFDVNGMLDVLHPNVEFINIADDELNVRVSGKDEFQELAQNSKKLFTSRTQTLVSIDTTDEKIFIDISFKGTLAKDLPNGMLAGETVKMNGQSVFEFKDGRISRIVDYC